MSSQLPWTIGRLLEWTTEHFRQAGSSSARLDAEVLLAEAKKCERIELYTAFDEVANESIRQGFRELVRRHTAGEPVAYLVGQREFYSLPFQVSPAVLIPRPETELLVMTLLDLLKPLPVDQQVEVADVGTGSGCIAISTAKHASHARLTAIDIDSHALQIAKSNAAANGVDVQITFVESDLFQAVPDDSSFEFIVSNPPYVSQEEWQDLSSDVKDYEPTKALVGGPTGVEVIERLIPEAAARLVPGGTFLLEISPMIQRRVLELFRAEAGFGEPSTIRDLSGHARIVRAEAVPR